MSDDAALNYAMQWLGFRLPGPPRERAKVQTLLEQRRGLREIAYALTGDQRWVRS